MPEKIEKKQHIIKAKMKENVERKSILKTKKV